MKQHLMLDRLLTLWSGLKSSDRFRAIDLQVGQQIQTWEHGRARMPEQDLPVSALLGCLVSYCLSRGQVCLRLDRSPIFELTDAWPSAEYWLALLEKMSSVWFCSVEDAQESGGGGWQGQPLIFEVAGDGIQRLYLARYYFYQQDVIDQIHQRRTSIALDSDQMDLIREWLPKLFPMPQSEVDWQAIAAVTALRQSVTLIVGGPGTGKTTTVTRLMAFLNVLNPRVRIAMAAPTGKAASRMTESVRNAKGQLTVDLSAHLPEEASTLHRLLGWGPSGFRYGTDRPLPYDCLIIDEASMIDLPMMRHLVTALSPTAKLVLLGDKHQLTSVEAGSVLSDFCGSERTVDRDESYLSFLAYLFGDNVRQILPYREGGIDSSNGVSGYRGPLCNSVVELQVSHRFSRDSGIGKLASLIKRGDADRSFACFVDSTLEDLTICYESGESPESSIDSDAGSLWLNRIWQGYQPFFDAIRKLSVAPGSDEFAQLFKAFNRFRVLSATRDGALGVRSINTAIKQHFYRSGSLSGNLVDNAWYPGRAVMVIENDYDTGLFNGDIGIAVTGSEGGIKVVFEGNAGSYRSFMPVRLPRHETCFAMTVHKSQGSEFDEVMLMLPIAVRVATRELLYTAVTRSKRKFTLVANTTSWKSVMGTVADRSSALREHLWTRSLL